MAIAIEALPEAAEAAEGGSAAAGAEGTAATAPKTPQPPEGPRQSRQAPAPGRASAQPSPRASARTRGGSDTVETVRSAYERVSTPSAAAQTLTKLIWAVALGLIVLQIAAEATGQQWSFALPAQGKKPAKQPYRPLYAGQASAAMPGYPISGPTSPAPGPSTGGGPILVSP